MSDYIRNLIISFDIPCDDVKDSWPVFFSFLFKCRVHLEVSSFLLVILTLDGIIRIELRSQVVLKVKRVNKQKRHNILKYTFN